MTPDGRFGVGIVGAGKISDQYLANMITFPDLEVIMVADLFPERAAAQAEAYGIAASGTPAEAINAPEIDLIVNLTNPQSHVEVSTAALQAGRHVFTEKPLATDRESGRTLITLADERGLRIGSAPDTFLGSGIQTALRMIAAGDIGTPLTGLTLFEVPGPVDDHRNLEILLSHGAGPLWDMGPYYLTALAQVFGSFARVFAVGRTARPRRVLQVGSKAGRTIDVQVPTHVSVIAEFVEGAAASSVLSWDSPHRRVGQVEIVGTDATLSIPDPNTFEGTLRIRRKADTEWTDLPSVGPAPGRGAGPLDIARSVAAGVPHRASGELAFHVLDTMAAITESVDRGTPVGIDSVAPRSEPVPLDWAPTARTL